jgi:hypothetical protein
VELEMQLRQEKHRLQAAQHLRQHKISMHKVLQVQHQQQHRQVLQVLHWLKPQQQ